MSSNLIAGSSVSPGTLCLGARYDPYLKEEEEDVEGKI
jgi:hypothetical protein